MPMVPATRGNRSAGLKITGPHARRGTLQPRREGLRRRARQQVCVWHMLVRIRSAHGMARRPGPPARKTDDKPLHPSWEAKRRLKEKQNPAFAAPQGKKIVFD